MAFFTAAGRLRRRTYFLRVIGLYVLGIAIYGLPELLYGANTPEQAELLVLLGFMLVGYLVIVQVLRRLHDLNISAWWALLALVPLVSYVLGAGLQFVQGSVGPNRFGPDPKRPGLLPELSQAEALPTDLP